MGDPDPGFLEGFGRATDPGSADLTWLAADGSPPREIARILATVDRERALTELGLPADRIAAALAAAVDEPLLGARAIVLDQEDGRPAIVLVEPSTEGRLSATLARHGEGDIGRYVAAPADLSDVRVRATRAGVVLSRTADGPFGPEVLVVGGPVTGPHVVLCEAAAVPSRP